MTTKAPFLGLAGLTTIGKSGNAALTPRSTAPARVLKHPHEVLRSKHRPSRQHEADARGHSKAFAVSGR